MNGPAGISETSDTAALAADAVDLRLHNQSNAPQRRAGVALRLAASLLIHLAGAGALIYVALYRQEAPPAAVEIPVELVPPPEEQPQPQAPEQKPPAPSQEATLDEKPATDAPRPESAEKADREAPDKVTRGPREAKVSQQSAALRQTERAAPEAAEEKADAEAIRDASKDPSASPKPQAEPDKPQPKPGALSDRELLAAFQPLPDYEFGAASRKTPVAGGSAKSTYLTILFGMVMPNMRVPPGVHHVQGKIGFGVDSWGSLTHIGVQKSSGSPELDYAAIAAIRAAAPFPAPPNHRSIGLTFSYGAQ
ncbi:MAG: TonB family protein [Hyphomicrobiales bacterium]|nr:TonB family protein [Hyphomicrobiales bacterium]